MDINKIINLYYKFPRYKDNTYSELFYHIFPSIKLNQYKLFEDQDGVYGFCNWAFLNKDKHNYFIKTGIVDDWNCGNLMTHIDFVATKNITKIMNWLKNNCAKSLGLNKTIYWVRLSDENKVRKIMKQTTKDSWLWVE